jgi:hypothetical protein
VEDFISPETVLARTALLDALEALGAHRMSVILVGAQAIYLRTGTARVALAEYTTDADLAIDARTLGSDPRIEDAMASAGFTRDPTNANPGAWISARGIPVDLMVPAGIGGAGRRGVTVPPHDRGAMRRTVGLEAALVDNDLRTVSGLASADRRQIDVRVAGLAASLVAKLHKVGERRGDPRRLDDKDAHDIYRILVAVENDELADKLRMLLKDALSAAVTAEALEILAELFAAGPTAVGSMMAGRAEQAVGEPAQVSIAVGLLSADLIAELARG